MSGIVRVRMGEREMGGGWRGLEAHKKFTVSTRYLRVRYGVTLRSLPL